MHFESSCQGPIRQISPVTLLDPTRNASSLPRFQVALLPTHAALPALLKFRHNAPPLQNSKLSPSDQHL